MFYPFSVQSPDRACFTEPLYNNAPSENTAVKLRNFDAKLYGLLVSFGKSPKFPLLAGSGAFSRTFIHCVFATRNPKLFGFLLPNDWTVDKMASTNRIPSSMTQSDAVLPGYRAIPKYPTFSAQTTNSPTLLGN